MVSQLAGDGGRKSRTYDAALHKVDLHLFSNSRQNQRHNTNEPELLLIKIPYGSALGPAGNHYLASAGVPSPKQIGNTYNSMDGK